MASLITNETKAAIIEAVQSGRSRRQVAADYGVAVTTVCRYARQGQGSPSTPGSASDIAPGSVQAKLAGKMKRVVVISDLHCGHLAGLTPPQYRSRELKWERREAEAWEVYCQLMRGLQPIECLIVNGDLVDGQGERSGGRELLTTDMNKQVDMAAACIMVAKAGKVVITRGTPYHTGKHNNWEDMVADKVGAYKIGNHEWVDVNAVIFDCKHKVPSSTVKHGRGTPVAKEKGWNDEWVRHHDHPDAHVLIRSHVHYFAGVEGVNWWGCTTPALQGYGSAYGEQQCSGTIDWGMVSFDVKASGPIHDRFYNSKYKHIITLASQKIEVVKV